MSASINHYGLAQEIIWSELLTLPLLWSVDRFHGGFSLNVSNPGQNRIGRFCHSELARKLFAGSWPGIVAGRKSVRADPVEINIRRFRSRLHAKLASVADRFSILLATLRPGDRDLGSQRMCPFCGLITPRRKTCCLECGKSFKLA